MDADNNELSDNHELENKDRDLFNRVVEILEQARTNIVRSINSQMVIAYWLIGREIVEKEQEGENRAEYGNQLIEDLSYRLTESYGKGFSSSNLWLFRQFYVAFQTRQPFLDTQPILDTVCRESDTCNKLDAESKSCDSESCDQEKGHAPSGQFTGQFTIYTQKGFSPSLAWSHYRLLMRIEREPARSFYEIEAVRNRWSVRQLERQINSLLFERLLKSRDKEGVLKLANEGQIVEKPIDAIKDPYVLEFLDLPESHRLVESKLEEALINHLQEFLLELGSGFAFMGRQKRLTLDGDHFYPDLVFYHIKLKCYVIIDLKVVRLSHQDLGQMQMYVHYYDREIREPGDNPTIGLILCTDKNDAVVQYVLDEENRQIFASRYRFVLPDEKELVAELKREMELLSRHVTSGPGDNPGDNTGDNPE